MANETSSMDAALAATYAYACPFDNERMPLWPLPPYLPPPAPSDIIADLYRRIADLERALREQQNEKKP